MDVLIVEPLETEVVHWLETQFHVRRAPELARDAQAFRQSISNVRAVIVPPSVAIDARVLGMAPRLLAVGRVSSGPDSVDAAACQRSQVEVVRSPTASAQAEAEFMVGALLALLRRVPVASAEGLWVGRELGSATVGLLGMPPAARALAHLLRGFGSPVVGYDPSMHASDTTWQRWRVQPVGLSDLLEMSDAVCVQLSAYSRYRGLLGERHLSRCKPQQVIVSISHSGLFDEVSLARVLKSGRVAAAWLDSVEPGTLDAGRPLAGIDTLQVTPCVASTSRESRLRSAWAVARRIAELLGSPTRGAEPPVKVRDPFRDPPSDAERAVLRVPAPVSAPAAPTPAAVPGPAGGFGSR